MYASDSACYSVFDGLSAAGFDLSNQAADDAGPEDHVCILSVTAAEYEARHHQQAAVA